ncbi:uncharacterized protein LOC113376845 isoform X2 [Ctenocephalides felis]|nr:uncharacterized protein LOC113376845 isoform X2 [Ctenocephalides felis]XP_026472701.1 uncharacterized protein LOC113376845 isoform X2 [Ctenocephalides felis]
MSKDNADSGFGFKDKAKAEETLKLLESEDSHYQVLTVKGLLGRAKKVLTLTKDEEKRTNIQEAISVFEKWVEENAPAKKPKNDDDDDKGEKNPETVPGLGFKDKEKAEESLKLLEGRDPDYMKLAVKGLLGRAKRVLQCTKAEDKINNINEAINVFNKFLDEFETKNMGKNQRTYLTYSIVQVFKPFAEKYEIKNDLIDGFLAAYAKVPNYKHLRTISEPDSDTTWDVIRNRELAKLEEQYKNDDLDLFEMNKDPSKIHVEMIMWGYSPNASVIKKMSEKLETEQSNKRKSTGEEDDGSPKKKK